MEISSFWYEGEANFLSPWRFPSRFRNLQLSESNAFYKNTTNVFHLPLKPFVHDPVTQVHITSLMHTDVFFALKQPVIFYFAHYSTGIFAKHPRTRKPAEWAVGKLSAFPLSSEQQTRCTRLSAVRQNHNHRCATRGPSQASSFPRQWSHQLWQARRSLWACSTGKMDRSKWEREKQLIILSRWKLIMSRAISEPQYIKT